ncbi:MAG TPA: 50S ribosomal protein L13 [bacterium]|nr:50S ribosomal protein L13 [bacterium]
MNITRSLRKEDAQHKWFEIDAAGKTLGRLATRIATILRGKDKPFFTPHVDCGDYVIVTNADKVVLTGAKWNDKLYYSYSGYQSGMKAHAAKEMVTRRPDFIVTHAVKGMLPKNKLGRAVIKKLKVYAGTEHPHQAQSPVKIEL